MKTINIIENIKAIILATICFVMLLTSCITPFDPDIKGQGGVLVVDGSIIKGNETQVIVISKTAPISNQHFIPVEDCNVKVVDNQGGEFVFEERSPGKYYADIDDALLNYNNQYKLVFSTSSGDNYESEYQVLLQTTPIENVYSLRENHYSTKTGKESIDGMQFYVDLNAPESASRYYRWVLEETWENRTSYIWGEYDGSVIRQYNQPDSLYRCWNTRSIAGLYSASTANLSQNRIEKIPLHFVEKRSKKLNHGYCLTMKQYALNEDAYKYWHQKEIEYKELGDIFSIQPSRAISNIHNLTNPDEEVLGYFWASSFTMKRFFVKISVLDQAQEKCDYIITYSESNNFDQVVIPLYEALRIYDYLLPDPPVYIIVKQNVEYHIVLTSSCADCRTLGGNIIKPSFWQEL